jgi:SAM-dependent methyltransferase
MAGTRAEDERGIAGPLAGLYDVFVDWPGRLAREMPGLSARLAAAGARRVLDVGCGTGRHVRALLDAGFDAHGADVSEAMLAQAREHVGDPARLHAWRMGTPASAALSAAAPFDAITCLGNAWPSLLDDREIAATLAAFRRLLVPGGSILIGLKAVAIRRESGQPYLPLLKRMHAGEALFFVRFCDFSVAPSAAGGADLCDFHMTVLRGDAAAESPAAVLHSASRWRVWSPASLERCFGAAGLEARVSASLGDPEAPPTGEDVFVHATLPR